MTCETRGQAEDVLSEKLREARQGIRPAYDPDITVETYAKSWLKIIAPTIKPRTLLSYEQNLRLHILPKFGSLKLCRLTPAHLRAFLAEKLSLNFSRATVRIMYGTVRAMLNAAVVDGVILANPTVRIGRQFRLSKRAKERQEEIKAMSREQLVRFLAAAELEEPRYAPLFLTLARAGPRLGEVRVLQWDDLDFATRELRITRGISAGEIGTTKTGTGRLVDMSLQLKERLARLLIERRTEKLKRRWSKMPPWVFCSIHGTIMDEGNVRRAMRGALKAAKLPGHFTPHCLRHTFASLLLQQGESPVYVMEQLGHASIRLTVDTYGKWLPKGNKAAVDRLDDAAPEPSGSKVVANQQNRHRPQAGAVSQGLGLTRNLSGGGYRDRTGDLLIANQPLSQLS